MIGLGYPRVTSPFPRGDSDVSASPCGKGENVNSWAFSQSDFEGLQVHGDLPEEVTE